MATALRNPDLVVDQKAIFLHPNLKEHKPVEIAPGQYQLAYKARSLYDKVTAFTATAFGGPFRLGQLGDRVFKMLNVISPNSSFKSLSSMFQKGWTVTIIPRLFGVNKEAKESVEEALAPHANREVAIRRYAEAVHGVTDAASAWCYSSSLILGCIKQTADAWLTALRVGDAITFVCDVTEVGIQGQDLAKAHSLGVRAKQINANPEVLKTVEQTEKFHFLKVLKAICSVAGFILGTAMALTGTGTLLGLAIAAASISLASTIFSVGAGLHEEGMKYERIKFFNEKSVQPLTTATAV